MCMTFIQRLRHKYFVFTRILPQTYRLIWRHIRQVVKKKSVNQLKPGDFVMIFARKEENRHCPTLIEKPQPQG